MSTNTDYEALADRAEAGRLAPKPDTLRRGAEARAEAARVLMAATGATRVEDVVPLALGRPRVGQETGPSPTVRTRVPQALKDQLAVLAQEQHRTESELFREALTQYLAARGATRAA